MKIRQPYYNNILYLHFDYIVVETKYTINHIERTLYKDRGRIKWIADTKYEAYDVMDNDEEAKRSHIDRHDLFPRLYFSAECFLKEFDLWLSARNLDITECREGSI